MPVNVKRFYSQNKGEESDNESELRWGQPKLVSDIVIPASNPPSELPSSTVLSAPSCGFSSPNGSVKTSEPRSAVSSRKQFSFPQMMRHSRFANALKKQANKKDVQIEAAHHAVEVMTQLQRKNDLPLPRTNTTEKCAVWIKGCGQYSCQVFFPIVYSLGLFFNKFLSIFTEYSKDGESSVATMPLSLVDYSPSSNSSLPSSSKFVET